MSSSQGGGIHYPLGEKQVPGVHELHLPPTGKMSIDPGQLDRPLRQLKGVGEATGRRLAGLGLETVGDLILHLPFRHESPSRMAKVAELSVGEEVTLRVTVISCACRESARRRVQVLEALVGDETGSVLAVWYNQAYLEAAFSARPEVLLRGVLTRHRGTSRFLVKRHEIIAETGESLHILGLVPVYPSTADLSIRTIRRVLHEAVPYVRHLVDPLPARLLAERRYPGRADAVMAVHHPADERDARRARRRLAFEELLLLQTAVLNRRRRQDSMRQARPFGPPSALTRDFIANLPYAPTRAQARVMSEIERDLAREIPMRRLLHGDVGSGKTMVAVYSMLRAIEQGGQAALMAPTEVLADQHYVNLVKQLTPLGVDVRLVKGSQAASERRAALDDLAAGRADIAVGTHALIQDGVSFRDLQVAVVDEQHRFGVRQRDAILAPDEKGAWPHTLHMSATPIPRTLSLTLYGDLDVSVLDEMPPGRVPVHTRLVFGGSEKRMWEFVRARLKKGRQAYVVCPLIEESESLQTASARRTWEALAGGELAGFRVRLLHGQLPASEKAAVMASYASGEVDALVSTTVIEVGVDVPNATVMVIMGARRFGLSQLHQLRGRVGRGVEQSYCFLLVEGEEEAVLGRLALFARTNDGFALAEADLVARGEGQLFGDRQSGLGDLQVASLLRDRALLEEARSIAGSLLRDGRGPVSGLVLEMAERRFGGKVDWIDRV